MKHLPLFPSESISSCDTNKVSTRFKPRSFSGEKHTATRKTGKKDIYPEEVSSTMTRNGQQEGDRYIVPKKKM